MSCFCEIEMHLQCLLCGTWRQSHFTVATQLPYVGPVADDRTGREPWGTSATLQPGELLHRRRDPAPGPASQCMVQVLCQLPSSAALDLALDSLCFCHKTERRYKFFRSRCVMAASRPNPAIASLITHTAGTWDVFRPTVQTRRPQLSSTTARPGGNSHSRISSRAKQLQLQFGFAWSMELLLRRWIEWKAYCHRYVGG